ncbi:MerC domain-containing protein [Pontibacter sp. G13]|uniref:MerC domain-containing protein n=1 Tax=Pontibacter sp. G13 TaxID=3074898 RepID=UPI00288B72D6|nr:MerC domain-containing protein [Pontibacter sp. G13]WNJ19165.1 MerC domain-containing protein [Pontibacter sp. G13]
MISTQLDSKKSSSDIFGALASGLCLIHCVATPFLFAAQAGAAHHDHHHHHHGASPEWWGWIDLTLLVVSAVAIYWAVKRSSKQWVKIALWASWAFLTFIILNEKMELLHLAEAWIYAPAVSLVALHLYNRKYCQCEDDACCATPAHPSA